MDEQLYNGRVIINVSGVIFETRLTTLARYPDTLLGCNEKRRHYYDNNSKQYFFNRNRQSFEAILYYYQSKGRLSRPPDMPFDIFKEEVEFFQLGDEVLDKLSRKEGYVFDSLPQLPNADFQRQVWECLEYPNTSKLANLLTLISLAIILASVLLTIFTTVSNTNNEKLTSEMNNSNVTSKAKMSVGPSNVFRNDMKVWYIVELTLNCLFAFEYMLRLGFSPNKWIFLKSPLNLVDLLAFLPYMVILVYSGSFAVSSVSALHILRIVRIFRVFKISRYSRRLKVIGYCLLESVRDLGLFMVCLVIIIVLASSFLHYIEGEKENSPFTSIPSTFWFVIQTISTVGYGDEIPLSVLGRLATCAVAVFGVVTLALPILSFVAHFNTLYYQNINYN